MKLVPFLLALTLLGAVASSAGAATSSTATAKDLCSEAKSVGASITNSTHFTPTAGSSLTSLEASLKASFTHIKAAESIVLAESPGSLKPHFERVFAFDNMVYSELSKANWNFVAFAKNASSLEAGAAKVKPDIAAIQAYFNKCKKG